CGRPASAAGRASRARRARRERGPGAASAPAESSWRSSAALHEVDGDAVVRVQLGARRDVEAGRDGCGQQARVALRLVERAGELAAQRDLEAVDRDDARGVRHEGSGGGNGRGRDVARVTVDGY